MKRYFLSCFGALLVAAGTASAQTNAMTPVSSTQLYMNGSLIGTGKATITPVDARGTAIPIVTAAGRWYFGGLSATITNGVIASGFTVPDQCTAAATTPNTPINYLVQISANISPTVMPTTSYVIPASTPAVCGSTSFALDSYVPAQAATISPAGLITAAAPPAHCTAPSIYYSTTPGVPESRCYGGVFVQDSSSGGASSAPIVTTIASSGATQALSFPNDGSTAVYDITLSANCTISFTGSTSTGKLSRIILIIRPAGFTATLPVSSAAIIWAGGVTPSPSITGVTVLTLGSTGVAPILGGM